eukprot:1157991-Pelagomonas_calceolata.AAC.3
MDRVDEKQKPALCPMARRRDSMPHLLVKNGRALSTASAQQLNTQSLAAEPGKSQNSPAVTEPPGELTYIVMSFLGSAESRYNSCATRRFAMSSSTAPPKRTILCSKEKQLGMDNSVTGPQPSKCDLGACVWDTHACFLCNLRFLCML